VSRRFLTAALLTLSAGCALSPPGDYTPAVEGARPSSPWIPGNEAALLVDGPRALSAMFAAMAAARDHINLETYILDDSDVGQRLAELLQMKVKQGVKAQVMYDAIGSIKTPKEYFERLEQAGVRVCKFNPVAKSVDRVNNRDHRKILVVDGRVGFTGGINISETYRSSSVSALRKPGQQEREGWRDTQVRIEGPAVTRLQRLFLDGWALQDCGPYAEASYYPRLERRGDKTVRVVASEPGRGSEMYTVLLQAIAQAKKRVWLTFGYFAPDRRTLDTLIDAAKRGVDVELVLPGYSDHWAPLAAGRSHYSELLDAGIRIYEWREALLHAKTAVIDTNWSSVGSTNLDARSFVHNYEADVLVRDAAFARDMERRFRRDVEAAVVIEPEGWKRRSLAERFKEWFARQWEYML
jgi:cardiolipin synthase